MQKALFLILFLLPFTIQAQVDEYPELFKFRNSPKLEIDVKHIKNMDNYNVLYYGINLESTNENNYITGDVFIQAKVVDTPLSVFEIQLIDQLSVSEVKLNGQNLQFTHSNNIISCSIENAIPIDALFVVEVKYMGYTGEGMFTLLSSQWGKKVTCTISESFHSMDWFPVKQSLTDKIDSVDINITVPSNLEVASNGLLFKIVTLNNDTKRYEWQSRYPIAYYLIAVTVSDYIEYNTFANPAGMSNPLLIQNFIYNTSGCLEYYKEVIDQTDEMIELYADLFGPYPFPNEKYGHVMAPFGGGMEHQTITSLGYFSTSLVSHELAHMWFGDYVTCGTWQDIWINEGFASYAEYIYKENMESQNSAEDWMSYAQSRALLEPNGSVYLNPAEAQYENRIFSMNLSYKKGAAILHMLRYEINDDNLFFSILREYLNRFANKTATGEDFKSVVNEMTGKDYSWFFEQWYYGYGFPIFSFQYGYSDNHAWVTVSQTTTSTLTPFFKTSMDFNFSHESGSTYQRVLITENPQTFTFEIPPINGLQVDAQNWIIKKINSITSDPTVSLTDLWVNIGPNPFHDLVFINFPNNLPCIHVTIYDDRGNRLLLFECDKHQTLDLSSLSRGIYIIKIDDGNRIAIRKMIKE